MPAIVDHRARRHALAEVAAELISAGGVEAATVRSVAAAAGYSTKVVSHYFEDKRALLLATYRFAATRASVIAEATQRGEMADPGAFARALLPIRREQRRNWLVWYSFWAYAVTDQEFAGEQRGQVNAARARLVELMQGDPAFARWPLARIREAARDLMTEVMGIALQAVFDRAGWTRRRQQAALDRRMAEVRRRCHEAASPVD